MAAYSLGNSFGYLDDEGNDAFLEGRGPALKPGARFVLETGYVAETLLPVLQERGWYPIGDMLILSERRYDPVEGRLHVEYTHIRDGKTDRRTMSARIHTCREVFRLLEGRRVHRLASIRVHCERAVPARVEPTTDGRDEVLRSSRQIQSTIATA